MNIPWERIEIKKSAYGDIIPDESNSFTLKENDMATNQNIFVSSRALPEKSKKIPYTKAGKVAPQLLKIFDLWFDQYSDE